MRVMLSTFTNLKGIKSCFLKIKMIFHHKALGKYNVRLACQYHMHEKLVVKPVILEESYL